MFRIYTNDDILLSRILVEIRPSGSSATELTGEEFVGKLDTRNRGTSAAYDVYKDSERYRVVSSRSKDRTRGAQVSKSTVERVYSYLKSNGKKRSSHNIETALGISTTLVLNALKVLRMQKRARLESFGKHGKQQFRAI